MALSLGTRPPSLIHRPLLPLSLPGKPTCVDLPRRASTAVAKLVSAAGSPSADPSLEIHTLCLSGRLKDALLLLDSNPRAPLEEDAYVALVSLCRKTAAEEAGRRVYSHLLARGVRPGLKLGNALLSMLVRFEDLDSAWKVFAGMLVRDVFCWNTIVCAYGRLGMSDEALDLYHRMLWAGAWPDVFTFPSVLRTCATAGDVARGREVHAHVVRFGLHSTVDVLNALITMYAKCGEAGSARKVFDAMRERDRISWNAMISGYFENGMCEEGLELFRQMKAQDPDLKTMTSVISASKLVGDQWFGKEVHGYAIKMGFIGMTAVKNALLEMYFHFMNVAYADKIFAQVWSKDLLSWTTMISGYVRNGLDEQAIRLYEEIESQRLLPDEAVVVSVLAACASTGNLGLGARLHEIARTCRLMSSIRVCNVLIDMYTRSNSLDKALEIFNGLREKDRISWVTAITGLRINGKSFEALQLFREMLRVLDPTNSALTSALSACSAIGALMHGKEIHAFVLRRKLESHDFLFNAILDLYVKCGRIESACRQFASYADKDVSSWNIMLNGYARLRHGEKAIAFFKSMEEAGVVPDEVTFVTLLSACSRSRMLDEGRYYFSWMTQKYSIAPNIKHCTSMVDMLARSGLLEEAGDFITKMPLTADAAIWAALLNGCRIHRNMDMGELMVQKVLEFNPKRREYYVLLYKFYSTFGRWDKVVEIRKMMMEKGFLVEPGCCWVEIKGKVHCFLSADESHPQIKEINAVLSGLYGRMKSMGLEASEIDSGSTEASKAEILCGHSERKAIAFVLLNSIPGMPIWVTKNLYMCKSCHYVVKNITKIVRREITVRDAEQFHHFKDGECSCNDVGYWGDCREEE